MAETHADGQGIMSTWYKPGPEANWRGRIEALDDDRWIWHKTWPLLSTHVERRKNSVLDNTRSQWWVLVDTDLDMDIGL